MSKECCLNFFSNHRRNDFRSVIYVIRSLQSTESFCNKANQYSSGVFDQSFLIRFFNTDHSQVTNEFSLMGQ